MNTSIKCYIKFEINSYVKLLNPENLLIHAYLFRIIVQRNCDILKIVLNMCNLELDRKSSRYPRITLKITNRHIIIHNYNAV